jgi:hypothetical protein
MTIAMVPAKWGGTRLYAAARSAGPNPEGRRSGVTVSAETASTVPSSARTSALHRYFPCVQTRLEVFEGGICSTLAS